LQFKDAFSLNAQTEGCNQTGGCTNYISPEQAFYNVLQVYFDGTGVGAAYGVTPGNLPLNYLQVWYSDVLYANTNSTGSAVVDGFGATNNVTAQSEFDEASSRIFEIAEPSVSLPPALALQTVETTLQLTWPASAAAFQLEVNYNNLFKNQQVETGHEHAKSHQQFLRSLDHAIVQCGLLPPRSAVSVCATSSRVIVDSRAVGIQP
jgi:hypothetical protein